VPRSNGPRSSARLRVQHGGVEVDLLPKNVKVEANVNNDTDVGKGEGRLNVRATRRVAEEGMQQRRLRKGQERKGIEASTTRQPEKDRKLLDKHKKRNQHKYKPVINRALGKAKVINAIDIIDD